LPFGARSIEGTLEPCDELIGLRLAWPRPVGAKPAQSWSAAHAVLVMVIHMEPADSPMCMVGNAGVWCASAQRIKYVANSVSVKLK
jgi:hypothetical protein